MTILSQTLRHVFFFIINFQSKVHHAHALASSIIQLISYRKKNVLGMPELLLCAMICLCH